MRDPYEHPSVVAYLTCRQEYRHHYRRLFTMQVTTMGLMGLAIATVLAGSTSLYSLLAVLLPSTLMVPVSLWAYPKLQALGRELQEQARYLDRWLNG